MLSEQRIQKLAAETLGDIKGPNDEIAADPTRWGEPMLSWSLDELKMRLAQALRTAAREAAESAAKDVARWQWARQDTILWRGTYDYGVHSPEDADAIADDEISARREGK